ncbi:MAG: hypothetical protein IPM35_18550 [Myxococcales bacterium]|nr:hypothetical protein [Myxococcales bacterium]
MRALSALAALPVLLALARCGSDDGGDGSKPNPDAGADATTDAPDDAGDADARDSGPSLPDAFSRYCTGKSWRDTFAPATVGMSSGEYLGVLNVDFGEGVQEGTKIVPEHPLRGQEHQGRVRQGHGQGALALDAHLRPELPGLVLYKPIGPTTPSRSIWCRPSRSK